MGPVCLRLRAHHEWPCQARAFGLPEDHVYQRFEDAILSGEHLNTPTLCSRDGRALNLATVVPKAFDSPGLWRLARIGSRFRSMLVVSGVLENE